MKPDIVVDIGNTRVKWGRCGPGGVVAHASLPGEPAAWQQQLDAWGLAGPLSWAVTGVNPAPRDKLVAWLSERGDPVTVINFHRQVPVQAAVDKPDHVGIDRLLNAVAARSRQVGGTPAIIIDAGTAVTVDWLDSKGVFRGGAILPGFRLMTLALHEHTAFLPVVDIKQSAPRRPGTSTPQAIETGVFWAQVGAVKEWIALLGEQCTTPASIYLTGGDGILLAPALDSRVVSWPLMTLEGVRISAEKLP